ncbi:MAG: hypothetical protein LAT52_03480 [Balneolales bacterium]|nr:hypothetical protein [Balneolales bacterium]
MKKYSVLLIAVLLTSCSFYGNSSQQDEEVIINSNTAELSTRITIGRAGAVNVTSSGSSANKWITDFPENDTTPSTDQTLTRIATVLPPEYNGQTLTASHVYTRNNRAFVGYNRMGPEYLGAIEYVDVSQAHDPKILSQIIFTSIDVSAVIADNDYVYFAGARDRDRYPGVETAAVLGRIRFNGSQFTGNVEIIALPGFAGTDLVFGSTNLYVSSGAEGGISRVNIQSFQVEEFINKQDVRSIAYENGTLAVVSGSEGAFLYNASDLTELRRFSERTASPNAKRTAAFYESYLLVAEGEMGAALYRTNSGNLIQHIEIISLDDAQLPSEIVTNAVSVTDNILWMANGAAGLSMARYADGSFTNLGVALLGGSTNFVQAENEYIYAAAGAEGLQILRRELPDEQVIISCDGAIPYNGPSWLNVNSNDVFIYSGAASLQGINVNNQLTFCGSLVVSNQLNVNSNALFSMRGSLAFGQLHGNTSLIVNSGAILRVEGSLVIYGNLIMNSNSTIEFVGEASSITIHGSVTRNTGSQIRGLYTDVMGKL